MRKRLTEGDVEESVLDWLEELGYAYVHGLVLAPDGEAPERTSYGDVILADRVRAALARLNPKLKPDVLEDVFRRLASNESANLLQNNHAFHKRLCDGVPVQFTGPQGGVKHDFARLFDFENVEENDWLVVNQFTIQEGQYNRRPDVIVFVNGFPLAVLELKNPGDENATIWGAFNQLQTYKQQIPSLFHFNEVLVVSDGTSARQGTLSSSKERFLPWRTADGETVAPKGELELEVLIRGIFDKRRFLDLVRNFVLFESDVGLVKKMAAYHQYHAVNAAVKETIRASRLNGDKRAGVVWHTQGSGKSISMVFYASKIIREAAMANPTVVLLTDRNDLDDQLLGTFAQAKDLIPFPKQAQDRAHLKDLLSVASGGVVFTTLQKFAPDRVGDRYPLLSDRRNIVVIADEAHRSQYDFIDGFARNLRDALPNASFIGFTGTPIEATDKSTRAVFGDYIAVYDIQRAVEDGATVRIYYENRLARIALSEDEKPKIDPEFEEVTEGEEEAVKQKLKSKWARLEAMVGTEKRLALVAQDIVKHFESRQTAMDGKAMIVCMSRRICVELYEQIRKIRPDWHGEGDDEGAMKVVMTGNATDPERWQPHIRNKARRERIQKRVKDAADPLKIVIVRDMWLTGFDAPPLHTMYVDKPMKGHNLMQAIARVNRVFAGKDGGLVVDYLGIADQLRLALADYTTESRQEAGVPIEQAVATMQEKYEIVAQMFHGFDYQPFFTGGHQGRLKTLLAGANHILETPEKKQRFLHATTQLRKAFALAVPQPEALAIRDEVGYFLTVRANVAKHTVTNEGLAEEGLDFAVRQIISKAVAPGEVIDIFDAAGLQKPEIGILSEEFLAQVKKLPFKNVQLELLRKLLNDQIKSRARRNSVEARRLSEMLETTIKRYQNRAIEAAQVIQELIDLAHEMKEADARGEATGLNEAELAFYDALAQNKSAVDVLGDKQLQIIARELVERVKENLTIDWTLKDSVRAKLRAIVRRLLAKHGYPPDETEAATQTVIEQAELLCKNWPMETVT